VKRRRRRLLGGHTRKGRARPETCRTFGGALTRMRCTPGGDVTWLALGGQTAQTARQARATPASAFAFHAAKKPILHVHFCATDANFACAQTVCQFMTHESYKVSCSVHVVIEK